MHRGRPIGSEIRQNIIDILFYMKKGYGYEIYKIYLALFQRCTNEVIYYHLKKGSQLGELKLSQVKQERGDFSWGPVAEKIYYSLGPKAKPRHDKRVADYFRKKTKH